MHFKLRLECPGSITIRGLIRNSGQCPEPLLILMFLTILCASKEIEKNSFANFEQNQIDVT